MTSPPIFTKLNARRAFLAYGGALCVTLGNASLGGLSFAQSNPRPIPQVRIQTSAMGQAAIGRVRGRLQISFDDLGLRYGAPIYLRLIKDQKRLEVWVLGRRQEFVRLRSYKVCGASAALGPRTNTLSPKQPEGFYNIAAANLRPVAASYLGLDLNWPNAFDRAHGWRGPTSLIQAGCASDPHFGLTDQDMEEIFALVHAALTNGQINVPLHIFPFAMSGLRMMALSNSPNTAFWRGLAPAWQAFERTKKPPQIRILGRRYVLIES